MIVLDTHAWVWWTHDPDRLTESQQAEIARNEGDSIGVSAISCWEVAKLAEYRRLALPWRFPIGLTRRCGTRALPSCT